MPPIVPGAISGRSIPEASVVRLLGHPKSRAVPQLALNLESGLAEQVRQR